MTHNKDDGIKEIFFSYNGRLNRLRYFKRFMTILGINTLIWLIFEAVSELSVNIEWHYLQILTKFIFIVAVIFTILGIVSRIMLYIRRLKDLDASYWWVLLLFIPFVNVLFLLFLFFKRGTVGNNKYGHDPLELSTINGDYNGSDLSKKTTSREIIPNLHNQTFPFSVFGYIMIGVVISFIIFLFFACIGRFYITSQKEGTASSLTLDSLSKSHEPGVFYTVGDPKEGILVNMGKKNDDKFLKSKIVLELNPNSSILENNLNPTIKPSAEIVINDIVLSIIYSADIDHFTADTLKTYVKLMLNQKFGKNTVYDVYIPMFIIQ